MVLKLMFVVLALRMRMRMRMLFYNSIRGDLMKSKIRSSCASCNRPTHIYIPRKRASWALHCTIDAHSATIEVYWIE